MAQPLTFLSTSPRPRRYVSKYAEFLLLVPSVLGVLGLMRAQTVGHGVFEFWLRYTVAPSTAALIWVVWRYRHLRVSTYRGDVPLTVAAVVAWVCLMMFAAGAVNWVNAAFPTGGTRHYSGPITSLYCRTDRGAVYSVDFVDAATHQQISLRISAREYRSLKVGMPYDKTLQVGRLGVPFELGWF